MEQGEDSPMLTERINKRQREKQELEVLLAEEQNKKIFLTEGQVMAFLNYVCEMPLEDMNKRRAIINILVHSVYLYDDYFTLIINTTRKPMSVDHIPLDKISHTFNEKCESEGQCSFNSDTVPPKRTVSVLDAVLFY